MTVKNSFFLALPICVECHFLSCAREKGLSWRCAFDITTAISRPYENHRLSDPTQVEQSRNLSVQRIESISQENRPKLSHAIFRVEGNFFRENSFFDSFDSILVFRQTIRKSSTEKSGNSCFLSKNTSLFREISTRERATHFSSSHVGTGF